MNSRIFIRHLILRSHLHNIHRLLMVLVRRLILHRNFFVIFGDHQIAEGRDNVACTVISQIA